jgi:hypothetical protein
MRLREAEFFVAVVGKHEIRVSASCITIGTSCGSVTPGSHKEDERTIEILRSVRIFFIATFLGIVAVLLPGAQ